MNYEDEAYVRLYTRRTVTNRRLGWEGRAVLHEMLYEFDRAGLFDVDGDPVDAVELVSGLPEEVVRVGLQRLFRTGTWVLTDTGQLFWPKFLNGQTARRSDKIRQQESRQRRNDTARARSVTARDETEQGVTERDQVSQGVTEEPQTVTPGHDSSHPVTLSLAEADLSLAEAEAPLPPAAATDRDQRIPMPPDWRLPEPARAALQSEMIPDWAIDAIVPVARSHYASTPSDTRTPDNWTQAVVKWVRRDMHDETKRPKKPGEDPAKRAARLKALDEAERKRIQDNLLKDHTPAQNDPLAALERAERGMFSGS